jgi:hypothetical protein
MEGLTLAQASVFRFVFPLVAAGLLGWWWLQSRAPEPAPSEAVVPSAIVATPAAAPARAKPGADSERVIPGGFGAPSLETATPVEVESMRRAEAARSVAAPAPPRSYIGADGKKHAFAYEQSAQDNARELALADRRALLMAQLRADPGGFARKHGLSAKEAKWILDGETDFPERLLD